MAEGSGRGGSTDAAGYGMGEPSAWLAAWVVVHRDGALALRPAFEPDGDTDREGFEPSKRF